MRIYRKDRNRINPKNGFTLIELLVVISIMSLLMSIMLPHLSRSRELAQRLVCGSNMRQLTMAWYIYSIEHNDLLCSAETGWKEMDPSNWVGDGPMITGNIIGGTKQALKDGAMWPYLKMANIYKCKTDQSSFLRSFAISRMMNGNTSTAEIIPYRSSGNIPRPAEKVVFLDAASRIGWIDGSFWPFQDITSGQPTWFFTDSRNITARHANGCNISFADMHVEYLKWNDRRTENVADWQVVCPLEASVNNKDITNLLELMKGF